MKGSLPVRLQLSIVLTLALCLQARLAQTNLDEGALTSGRMGRPAVTDPQVREADFSFPKANIILIGIDSLRPDHTTMYGYKRPTTPHLQELAAQSCVFKRCHSVAPWTLPSFMSMLTGLYPSVSGFINKWTPIDSKHMVEARLDKAVTTLPEVLVRQGYEAAAFTGDAGVSGRYGFGRAMSTYIDDLHFGAMDHSMPACLAWLRTRQPDKPFFLFLHGYDCHGQFDPPGGYKRRFVEHYAGKLQGGKKEQAHFRESSLRVALQAESRGEPKVSGMDADDAAFYRGLYDEKIYDVDERVHHFLEQLKGLGLYDTSIIIVVSDHGEEFLDHGGIDHGQSLYQELTHVLLMIHFPKQTQGVAFYDLVNVFDALPTAMEAAGIKIPHPINAHSLMPILRGGQVERPYLFAESDYRLFVHKRSVRNERYKLIYNLVSGKRELFDLKNDPLEQANVVDREPRTAYEMEQQLLGWLHGMHTDVESYRDRDEDYIKEF
jgi:choline-sulfatase